MISITRPPQTVDHFFQHNSAAYCTAWFVAPLAFCIKDVLFESSVPGTIRQASNARDPPIATGDLLLQQRWLRVSVYIELVSGVCSSVFFLFVVVFIFIFEVVLNRSLSGFFDDSRVLDSVDCFMR
nr:hypothetical protein [Rhodopirellula sp. MGV]